MSNWTLFSNHGHVLVCLANNADARLRDVATDVGITERAVQKIVRDLQTSGMISVTKHGRRNRYRIHNKKSLRHDLVAHCTLGDVLKVVSGGIQAKVKVKKQRTIESLSDLVKPVAPETEPVQAEASQLEIEPPEQDVGEVVEAESAKSEAPDSIERQQGSLF